MKIQHFFDSDTYTLTYVVSDPLSKDAVIIDPVLDFEQASGALTGPSIEKILHYVKENGLNVLALLETHAHADHLSSSQLLKRFYPNATVGIGKRIQLVQETFKSYFNIDYLRIDGSQFDKLFEDFEEVQFGTLKMK